MSRRRKGANEGGTDAATLTGARWWLSFSNAWRYPALWAYRVAGRLQRLRSRGWWPVGSMLAVAVAILILGPLLLQAIVWAVEGIGMNGIDPAPEVRHWLSLSNVALVFLALVFTRWISHARERVVVESFVDYTTEESKAVSGLSTLLVTELGRLRGLYEQVTELAVPTAVGVERQGGFSRGKEAASFLTVAADDVTSVLEGAVASDAKVEVGPAKISLGPLLAFVNRVTRGPRVVGAVHLTEAGGGPTLTAQLVGGTAKGTWRVDHGEEPETAEQRKAFLDTMVRELACRMYTQLTLGGSIRWPAVHAFNEYLRLYGDSQRTPRDRARFLKKAQGKLMSAVAEDERFDLAYYNLGVIYTQLAQAELNAERESQDATSRTNVHRETLVRARQEAARVAFTRAAEKNAARWEAYYALAVTTYSQTGDIGIDEALAPNDPRREQLRDVIGYCDQALRVGPRRGGSRAAVHDLRGMALSRLADDIGEAMRDHRRAVRGAWLEYARTERNVRSGPSTDHGLSDRARANATASLHNLALSYERRALLNAAASDREPAEPTREALPRDQRRDLASAERVFNWAIRLAGEGTDLAAAIHFERGGALEHRRKYRQAAAEFENAAQIHPTNCEYPARRARALASGCLALLAKGEEDKAAWAAREARAEATHALELLARPFSLAVSPHPSNAIEALVASTLEALEQTYVALDRAGNALQNGLSDRSSADRMKSIGELRRVLAEECRHRDSSPREAAARLRAERDRFAGEADRDWELAQIDLACGRAYAAAHQWVESKEILGDLVRRSVTVPAKALLDFSAYAHYSRALRECGDFLEALRTAAQCVRRDPLNVEGRREAGRAHFALGQYDDALSSWEQALWLSPSDPYLHYEVAMCHRQLSRSHGGEACQRELGLAAKHFSHAQELFDGEDLDGEAWTRLWLGRVALERGDPESAIERLEAAEHGTAAAAAGLLLGEAYLEREERADAEHAFMRCAAALSDPSSTARLDGRVTIDAGWGDELPEEAVRARLERGLAEACCLVSGPSQDDELLSDAERRLARAHAHLDRVTDPAHEESRDLALAMCLDTDARVLWAHGRRRDALERTRERLRHGVSPEALKREQELLDEIAAHEWRHQAERLWHTVRRNGGPPRPDAATSRDQAFDGRTAGTMAAG